MKAAVAEETKVDPIPGQPFLHLGQFTPESVGYDVQEFFFSGSACTYQSEGPATADGCWKVRPDADASYISRMVVLRPADAAKFNGTAVVEWLNVSGGIDAPAEWNMMHREIIRSGYAYVGVSVQKAGIDGGPDLKLGSAMPLKKVNPVRYNRLSHPGDAFSYDIFSQAGRVVRSAAMNGVLDGLAPKRVIAMGESQSAMYLTTYIAAIDAVAKAYDGFFIHSRFGPGAPLGAQNIFTAPPGSLPEAVRMHPRVPVLTLISESDLVGGSVQGFYAARQPDGPCLRTWEVAGTSHADSYALRVAGIDSGKESIAALAVAYAPWRDALGQQLAKPINPGLAHHYVCEAALASLDRWVGAGAAPPHGIPLKVAELPANGRTLQLATDEVGNALGGIRTPWVDVPTERLGGPGNSGGAFAWMLGIGDRLEQSVLLRLYPGGRHDYMPRFERALISAIEAGFILPADRREILELAAAMWH